MMELVWYIYQMSKVNLFNDTLSSTGRGNFAVANGLNFSGTDGYLSAQQGGTGVREYHIDRVRAVARPSNSSFTNFGANVNLTGSMTLTGNVVLTAGSTAVTGVGSRFAIKRRRCVNQPS